MVSDDEMDSDGIEEVPAKAKIPTKAEPVVEAEEEDDDEEDIDEYRVEKILKHDFGEEGVVIYHIKWLGYDKKADLTWEPLENL
jgi:chromobox protein 1